MKIVYAGIAVFLYIAGMALSYSKVPESICGNDAFWLAIAIVAAGAMIGFD